MFKYCECEDFRKSNIQPQELVKAECCPFCKARLQIADIYKAG